MISQTIVGWLTKAGQELFSGKVDAGLKDMTGNTHFTTLASAVTECQTAYAAYLVAKAAAKQGGKDLTTARDLRRAELVVLLRALLNNINAIANGDLEKLFSCGFPLRNTEPAPVGELDPPATPTAVQGKVSGTIKVSTQPIYGASLYTVRIAKASAPETYLVTRQSTSTRSTFEGLTPGELYNVEMNAIGAAGPSDWSDVGTIRVV